MLRQTCKKGIFRCLGRHRLRPAPPLDSSESAFHETPVNLDLLDIKDEQDFKDRVMRSSVPVIVNFHADWCEPCHELKPLLKKISEEYMGKIHIAEISVEEHARLLQVFEVTAVPAVLGIYRGSVRDKFIGLVSDKQIRNFVSKLVSEVSAIDS